MSPQAAGAGTIGMVAQQVAQRITDRLGRIEQLLARQLELSQSSRRNFLGAGSVAGGGTVGTTPAAILPGNPNRRGLRVQNLSASGGPNLTLGLGTTAPIPNTGVTLLPGGNFDGRVSGELWLGSVSVVGSAAGVVYSWLDA